MRYGKTRGRNGGGVFSASRDLLERLHLSTAAESADRNRCPRRQQSFESGRVCNAGTRVQSDHSSGDAGHAKSAFPPMGKKNGWKFVIWL